MPTTAARPHRTPLISRWILPLLLSLTFLPLHPTEVEGTASMAQPSEVEGTASRGVWRALSRVERRRPGDDGCPVLSLDIDRVAHLSAVSCTLTPAGTGP